MKNLKKTIVLLLTGILLSMSLASSVFALQLDPNLKPDNLPPIFTVDEDGGVDVDGDGIADIVALDENAENPEIYGTQTLIFIIGNIVSQVLVFAAAVSMITLIIAGINYIYAFGKDERIEKGKLGIFWSVMGLLTILFSYAIVQAVLGLLIRLDA
jgi:hypothetical protein